ncbi:MAG: hypothetical protein QF828_08505, partial [Pseudomonadales bacterium]|nr:hypothetical protein [Pseudomonadales bacterium]
NLDQFASVQLLCFIAMSSKVDGGECLHALSGVMRKHILSFELLFCMDFTANTATMGGSSRYRGVL